MSNTPIFYLEDSFEEEIQKLLEELNDKTKPKIYILFRNFFKNIYNWIKKIYNKLPIKINMEEIKQI